MTDNDSFQRSSRSLLLQAAEDLMLESGYAAVTSRRLAAKAGLKPQLVHYYFRTMDDLFVALYREFASDLLGKQQAALHSDKPLRAMWNVATEARGALLTEFIALANHRKALQKEISEFGTRYRRNQIEVMTQIFERQGIRQSPWTPTLAAVLLNSLARGLAMEGGFDMTEGHAETRATIEQFLERFDQ
jgi:AcrR family transcriptional regulator